MYFRVSENLYCDSFEELTKQQFFYYEVEFVKRTQNKCIKYSLFLSFLPIPIDLESPLRVSREPKGLSEFTPSLDKSHDLITFFTCRNCKIETQSSSILSSLNSFHYLYTETVWPIILTYYWVNRFVINCTIRIIKELIFDGFLEIFSLKVKLFSHNGVVDDRTISSFIP